MTWSDYLAVAAFVMSTACVVILSTLLLTIFSLRKKIQPWLSMFGAVNTSTSTAGTVVSSGTLERESV